ncbi:MAG: hypothetical protein IJJ31_01610, partial [Mogibacterium sp.]|nr:hypothetical protein [Mogibacterium sp.]
AYCFVFFFVSLLCRFLIRHLQFMGKIAVIVILHHIYNGEQIKDKKFAVTIDCFKDGELILQKGKKKFKKIVLE